MQCPIYCDSRIRDLRGDRMMKFLPFQTNRRVPFMGLCMDRISIL